MSAFSWGSTLVLMYVPLVMTLLFLAGALLLLYRTRSLPVGVFFVGTLLGTLGIRLIAPDLTTQSLISYQILITSIATTLQALGLMWYAFTVAKRV